MEMLTENIAASTAVPLKHSAGFANRPAWPELPGKSLNPEGNQNYHPAITCHLTMQISSLSQGRAQCADLSENSLNRDFPIVNTQPYGRKQKLVLKSIK